MDTIVKKAEEIQSSRKPTIPSRNTSILPNQKPIADFHFVKAEEMTLKERVEVLSHLIFDIPLDESNIRELRAKAKWHLECITTALLELSAIKQRGVPMAQVPQERVMKGTGILSPVVYQAHCCPVCLCEIYDSAYEYCPFCGQAIISGIKEEANILKGESK